MDKDIQAKFDSYPEPAKTKLLQLRSLILSIAEANNFKVEESLKWGEPSYAVKGGTPLRFDWKSKSPETISLYFHCQSLMVDTLREVMPDVFQYHGNRELTFPLNKPLSAAELKTCIQVAFTYQARRNLPLLGL
ncbi:DUF1801 domain-containing protein [Enterovibrio paralichthyis]|uniref:DUF1801 domain-containing protein n=1 Tax=Enterovibrio paralichthyis TaxID=2853805 RepID=UPI001C44B8DB|nr:DUF1801 domain-containing protein [Enterovibrio paralichthyis]MBV7296451.1 DUF1801 domain-containing protein [Enterovibrio paralichthyis]